MKMMKVALVLLVLASFVVATTAISMAATVTPTMKPMATKMVTPTMKPMATKMVTPTMKAAMPNATIKAPTMGKATMMPTKKPNMLIDLSQMQSNIGNIYKMLKNTTKMPKSMSNVGAGLTGKASPMKSGTTGKMTPVQGQSLLPNVPAPQAISKLAGMPQLGKMVKIA